MKGKGKKKRKGGRGAGHGIRAKPDDRSQERSYAAREQEVGEGRHPGARGAERPGNGRGLGKWSFPGVGGEDTMNTGGWGWGQWRGPEPLFLHSAKGSSLSDSTELQGMCLVSEQAPSVRVLTTVKNQISGGQLQFTPAFCLDFPVFPLLSGLSQGFPGSVASTLSGFPLTLLRSTVAIYHRFLSLLSSHWKLPIV